MFNPRRQCAEPVPSSSHHGPDGQHMVSEANDETGRQQQERLVRLFVAHRRELYAYILALLPNAADADDVFQETSVILWRRADTFDHGTSFLAWAFGVARNVARNARAKQLRSKLVFDESVLDRISAEAAELCATDEFSVRREALASCLEKLTPRDRDLLDRRYEPGMTIKSLAAAVGRPVEGVYKALQRLHDGLYDCVDKTLGRPGKKTT